MVPLKRSNNHRPPPNVSEATSEVPLDRPYLASRKILTNISEEMLHFGWSGCSLYISLYHFHPHKQTEILENWYFEEVTRLTITEIFQRVGRVSGWNMWKISHLHVLLQAYHSECDRGTLEGDEGNQSYRISFHVIYRNSPSYLLIG